MTPAQVGAAIEAIPQGRETFVAFREYYPDAYRQFLERMAQGINGGGTSADVEREAFQFMRAFISSKAEAIASAPEQDLIQLSNAYLELARALQGYSVPLCAQFGATGFSPGVRFSPEILTILNRINLLQIAAAGHADRGQRVARTPNDQADREAFIERLWAIDPTSGQILTSGGLAAAPPEQQCRVTVAIYQAVHDLPPARSAAMSANLLRATLRSPAQQPAAPTQQ